MLLFHLTCSAQVVLSKPNLVEPTKSQLRIIIRTMYSSPPAQGARIVATILGNKDYFNAWLAELVQMSNRIKEMRRLLFNRLKENGTPGTWHHIVDQIGMFSFTGLQRT